MSGLVGLGQAQQRRRIGDNHVHGIEESVIVGNDGEELLSAL